jgi:Domain of unknown function (DUF4188)
MSRVPAGRYASELDGAFVVFLIGMRIGRPWRPRRWLPVYTAMPTMLAALDADPDSGLLGWERALIRGPAIVQYWRSFEHLERFARASEGPHVAAWREWNRTLRDAGDVGIWHETYQVRAGEYEGFYSGMPRFGLAAAGRHVPLGSQGLSAVRHIGARDHDMPTPA